MIEQKFYHGSILFTLMSAFLITALLTGCEEVQKPKKEIEIRGGLIYMQADSIPYSGVIKDTVEGKLIEYEVLNGYKHGEFRAYFKNGNLQMEGKIQNNLNQGMWKYYYQSGQIESEGNFKDDLPDGVWKWYYENGNIREAGSFIMGNRQGKWIQYDISGNKTAEKEFKDNQPLKEK